MSTSPFSRYAGAGYRNRLVHFYDEVTTSGLYRICAEQLGEVDTVLDAILNWIRSHPDRVDGAI